MKYVQLIELHMSAVLIIGLLVVAGIFIADLLLSKYLPDYLIDKQHTLQRFDTELVNVLVCNYTQACTLVRNKVLYHRSNHIARNGGHHQELMGLVTLSPCQKQVGGKWTAHKVWDIRDAVERTLSADMRRLNFVYEDKPYTD